MAYVSRYRALDDFNPGYDPAWEFRFTPLDIDARHEWVLRKRKFNVHLEVIDANSNTPLEWAADKYEWAGGGEPAYDTIIETTKYPVGSLDFELVSESDDETEIEGWQTFSGVASNTYSSGSMEMSFAPTDDGVRVEVQIIIYLKPGIFTPLFDDWVVDVGPTAYQESIVTGMENGLYFGEQPEDSASGWTDGEVNIDGFELPVFEATFIFFVRLDGTVTVSEYWPYDPGDVDDYDGKDGSGPFYDSSDGSQLRDPKKIDRKSDGTFYNPLHKPE